MYSHLHKVTLYLKVTTGGEISMNFHQSPIMYVGRVHLKVEDIEQSIQFYEQIIGLKVLEKTDHKAALTADGKTELIILEQPKLVEGKTRTETGLYHLALLMPQRSDLANVVRHFINHDVRFGSADHLVSEALYLADPDGNGIEIYIDRNPSEWGWNNGEVAMTTDPLDFQDLLSIENQHKWNGLPEKTVMGHVHLQVSDLEQNERFYIDGLGFDVVNRYGAQALFISTHGYHHHIALNTWNGEGIPNRSEDTVGLKAFSLVLSDEISREKLISRLNKIGVTVSQNNGTYFTYDPSNIRIEFVVK